MHSIPNPPIRQISLIRNPKPRTKTNRRTPASCSVRQFICYISFFDMTSRSSKTKRNPNPSPTGTRFGFLLFGTGNRGRRTCRGYVLVVVSSKEYAAHILSRTCLALLPILKKKNSHEGCFGVEDLPRIRPGGRILKRICCAYSFTYKSCPITQTNKKRQPMVVFFRWCG